MKKVYSKLCFVLIVVFVALNFFSFSFLSSKSVTSWAISSQGVTTVVESPENEFAFNQIQKIYEVSSSVLKEGYSANLSEKDAFRINIGNEDYNIIVWNISKEDVSVVFPKERQLIFGDDTVILVDIDQDGKFDIDLQLNGIYLNGEKKVNLRIKEFSEEELIPSGDYFELFDVTVQLAEEEIYNSKDLEAFVIFENFGEGASEIEIIYSITDTGGEELYRGVDLKVVQTEDRVVKDFEFLDLPEGEYSLKTEIFYGKNQTGESLQDFKIVGEPIYSKLVLPSLFAFVIIVLFFAAKYGKHAYKGSTKSRR